MKSSNTDLPVGNVHPREAAPRGKPTSRAKKAAFLFAAVLILLVFAEGLCAIVLRFAEGQWPYTRPKSANYLLFEPHPDWLLTPRTNVDIIVFGNRHQHNSHGFRGAEFSPVKKGLRIGCIGGSTTYCVGVADDQTWPFYLERLLSPGGEVLNFGVPAHSTAEHKKLLPHVLARHAPDVMVFQMGLNDLRNMNVDDPGPDYVNFHTQSLRFIAAGASRRDRLPPCALVHGGVILLQIMKVLPVSPFPGGSPPGQLGDAVDARVVENFAANLDTLLRTCRSSGVRVLLLPHALSKEMIDEANYKWWAPYLTKQGIFNAETSLNAVMRSRADGDQVIYADFMDGQSSRPEEFCDPTHLNPRGNLRLARLLRGNLPGRWFQPATAPALPQ